MTPVIRYWPKRPSQTGSALLSSVIALYDRKSNVHDKADTSLFAEESIANGGKKAVS